MNQSKSHLAAFLSVIFCILFSISCKKNQDQTTTLPQSITEEADGSYPYKLLSTYAFFEGKISQLSPAGSLTYYEPASSLFTDYASKSRFIQVPSGKKIQMQKGNLTFPIGTILIKNFFYPKHEEDPNGEKQIIETRLLIFGEKGWEAWPYIWNEEQTEAYLKVVGGQQEITITNPQGKEQVINYIIPNKNQCKTCHNQDEVLSPIGVQVKHLNHDKQGKNQLISWSEKGILEGFASPTDYPSLINYEDDNQNLELRAMAYLDINCSHCHRAEGPASTSGLFLTYDERDPMKLGINKTPVAAGVGAGSHTFDVVPGKPDDSILIHRMNSTAVGVAMPELGRTTIHHEGVELIREWVRSLR